MKGLTLILGLLFSTALSAQVSPLLSTTWNQTCYYNAMMPAVGSGGSCGNAFTGCNATAMAQICKYYSYPTSGFGSHCNTNSPTNCTDYTLANYDYSLMPNSVTSTNAQVATLMYDLGVAVDMNWNGTNSTSFFSSKVLKEHYAYSPKMYSTAVFLFGSTAELIEALKVEMDAGRPVFAKGGGHFFLIDGYNASDEFHMNFGWGGTYDGYYPINAVSTPAGSFNPSNFVFNIMPMVDDLEVAEDTLFLGAGGTTVEEVEFTSLSNWTMSSTEPWITCALTSGGAGYFDFSEGSTANIALNNSAARTGYIIISNASETDTIVVVQESSPLAVAPSPINFPETGGVEAVNIDYTSWGTWTASASETWLTLSSSSGTGPASIDLTCAVNTGATRTAQLIIDGGAYVDTVIVTQQGSTAGMDDLGKHDLIAFPNPTTGKVTVQSIGANQEVKVHSILGEELFAMVSNEEDLEINLTNYPSGVYFIEVANQRIQVIKK
jgi:hypothetical protein